MGLPPASPRVKFVHGHPRESPVSRRPCNSSSTRSKSLELLDKEEEMDNGVLTVNRDSSTRPRSRSLDGFLDEDLQVDDSQGINIRAEEAVEWAEGSEKLNKGSTSSIPGSNNLEGSKEIIRDSKNFKQYSTESHNMKKDSSKGKILEKNLEDDSVSCIRGSKDSQAGSTKFIQGSKNLKNNFTKEECANECSMEQIEGLRNFEILTSREFQESNVSKKNSQSLIQTSNRLGCLITEENQGFRNSDELGSRDEQKNDIQSCYGKSKERLSIRKDFEDSNDQYQKSRNLDFAKETRENTSKSSEEKNISPRVDTNSTCIEYDVSKPWRASNTVWENTFVNTNIGESVSGRQEVKFVAPKPKRLLNNPSWKISSSDNSTTLSTTYEKPDKSLSEMRSEQCLGDSTSINFLCNPQPLPRHRNRGVSCDNLESAMQSNAAGTETFHGRKHQQDNLKISSEENDSDAKNIKKYTKEDKLQISSEESVLDTENIKEYESEDSNRETSSEDNALATDILKRYEIHTSNLKIPSEKNSAGQEILQRSKTQLHNLNISSDTEVPPRHNTQTYNLKVPSEEDCSEQKVPRRPPKGSRSIHTDKRCIAKARSCGAGLDVEEDTDHTTREKIQGSLLSLSAGAEPKRKRNFMDKCVNKVRAFMRK